MTKHAKAFIEFTTRLYVPLGNDLKDLQSIDLEDLFQHAKPKVHQTNTKRKGGNRDNRNA